MKLMKWLVGAGGVLQMLTGGIHMLGTIQGPVDEGGRELAAQMQAYRLPFPGGDPPSMRDALDMLNWTMSLGFIAMGAIVIGLVAHKEASDGLLRRVAWMNGLWLAVFATLAFLHRLPPPGILGAVTALVFLAALLPRTRRP